MKRVLPLILFAATLTGSVAAANDSVAERAAGGLVLKQSADIDMVSEDLFISADEVRVRYVFRNRAPRDVRVTVAFPLPDHDLRQDFYGDVAYPSDFATRVDGRPVAMEVELRAMLNGTDHGALLAGLDVPIIDAANGIAGIERSISALPLADRDRLVSLGLAEAADEPAEGPVITPTWTVRETRYWEQTFPAGRDLVVEHSYRPGTGQATATGLAHPEFLQGGDRQAMIDRYCIDDAFLAAVDRGTRRAGGGQPAFSEQWVSYILTTGANWRSPIGDFRLVVDKGEAGHLVSFCGEGVRRLNSTQFEVRHRDWRPTRDLHILILRPIPTATQGE
jgi:hypothetical protein